MTGLPALCAILNAPFLNGITRPDRERVPSGNVQRFTPSYKRVMSLEDVCKQHIVAM